MRLGVAAEPTSKYRINRVADPALCCQGATRTRPAGKTCNADGATRDRNPKEGGLRPVPCRSSLVWNDQTALLALDDIHSVAATGYFKVNFSNYTGEDRL